MAQYIDKEVIVAEIERRIKINKGVMLGLRNLDYYQGRVDAFNDALSFINTLEIKELDLDKEARNYLLNEHKSPLSAVFHQADLRVEMQYHEDIENAFKAGVEFGLKAQKGDE